MNCPVCSNEMVKAQATNFGESYDYCRTCKMELKEILAQTKTQAATGTSPIDLMLDVIGTMHNLYGLQRSVKIYPKAAGQASNQQTGVSIPVPNAPTASVRHMYDPMTKRCLCGSVVWHGSSATSGKAGRWCAYSDVLI